MSRTFLAFGSNMGNRLSHISNALAILNSTPTFRSRVLRCSAIYESLPMYYKEQGMFLNGVVELSTELDPVRLLQVCKEVEQRIGRIKTIDNGPRPIDLDILLYKDIVLNDSLHNLTIPHLRINEREFVLRPLADLIPNEIIPGHQASPLQLLNRLKGPTELKRYCDPIKL